MGYVPVEDWDGHSGEFASVRFCCCFCCLLSLLRRRLVGFPLSLSLVADTRYEDEEASSSSKLHIDIDIDIVR